MWGAFFNTKHFTKITKNNIKTIETYTNVRYNEINKSNRERSLMNTTFSDFNQKYNVAINSEMLPHNIFDEMNKTPYECWYIAKTQNKAQQLLFDDEIIINFENELYLCVK